MISPSISTNPQRKVTGGAPFTPGSAVNGVSLDGGGRVVLGNVVGGSAAQLLDNREMQMRGFDIHFAGIGTVAGGAGSLTIMDSPLNATATDNTFSNKPRLTIAGGKPTLGFNVVDEGTISSLPWGTSSFVYRTSNVNAPVLATTANFGNNVFLGINTHYGSIGGATPYVVAYEMNMAQNTGIDDIPFSVYGQGSHFAGVFAAPTVRVSHTLAIGWNDQTFPQATYALGQPQLTIRGGLTTQKNTYLELSNVGTSPANLENQIGFSVDNAPVVIASNYPSSKSVFALKSSTSTVTGTSISMYLGTTNPVQSGLTAQEVLRLQSASQSGSFPTVQITYRLTVGDFTTNSGYQVGKNSTFVADAFGLPWYWRNMLASAGVSGFIVRDATNDNVNVNNNATIAVNGVITAPGFVNSAGLLLMSSTAAFVNGAAAALGTLSNAPAAGNPTKWIPINDNGTTRYIPAW